MPVSVPEVINCLFLLQLVLLCLFSLMSRALLVLQWVVLIIMEALLMITASLPSFIFLNISLRCFRNFMSFSLMLSDYSVEKYLLYKLIPKLNPFFTCIGIYHLV